MRYFESCKRNEESIVACMVNRTGILFHPKHNVLLVTNRSRKRILIVDPGTGSLIQTIDPVMGDIAALGQYSDLIVLLQVDDGSRYKVSHLKLL